MAFTAFSTNAKVVEQAPKKRGWIALLLLAPGIAYMLLFFVAPFIQLAITSLQAPAEGGGTAVHWTGDLTEVTGLLKMVPKGLLQGAAQKVIDDVWAAVAAKLES